MVIMVAEKRVVMVMAEREMAGRMGNGEESNINAD